MLSGDAGPDAFKVQDEARDGAFAGDFRDVPHGCIGDPASRAFDTRAASGDRRDPLLRKKPVLE